MGCVVYAHVNSKDVRGSVDDCSNGFLLPVTEELATEGCDDHQSTLGKDGSLGGAIATLNVSCFGVEFTSKKPPV